MRRTGRGEEQGPVADVALVEKGYCGTSGARAAAGPGH
jgi:hypothetical protein